MDWNLIQFPPLTAFTSLKSVSSTHLICRHTLHSPTIHPTKITSSFPHFEMLEADQCIYRFTHSTLCFRYDIVFFFLHRWLWIASRDYSYISSHDFVSKIRNCELRKIHARFLIYLRVQLFHLIRKMKFASFF